MEKLKEEMQRRGLTADDLAAITGLSKASIDKRLAGKVKWRVDQVVKVAQALGGSIGWLFFGEIRFFGLKKAMQRYGISMKQLAKKTGIPFKTLERKLAGFDELQFGELAAIKNIFPDETVDSLFFDVFVKVTEEHNTQCKANEDATADQSVSAL